MRVSVTVPARFHRLSITATVLTTTALLLPMAAFADGASDSRFVADTNSARGARGLRHYAVAGDLTAVARRWAAHMAAHRTLAHNPSYGRQICCWSSVGENVGVGASVSQIQRAFMASAPHRANILSRSFTQVGIGTARGSDGRLYVDEVFRRPDHSAPRTTHTRTAAMGMPLAPAATRIGAPRASRTEARRPRHLLPPRPSTRQLWATRLTAARRSAAGAYADPVGGAVAYVRVVRALADSAGH